MKYITETNIISLLDVMPILRGKDIRDCIEILDKIIEEQNKTKKDNK